MLTSPVVQIRTDVLRWLCPSNVQDDLREQSSRCMPGSCDWFLEGVEYEALTRAGKPAVLTVLGRPGEGKTFLATFVVETLLQASNCYTLYFFCKAGDPEKRTALRVLRTLLAQLLRSDALLSEVVEGIYYNSGHAVAESLTDVETAFKLALQATQSSDIYIIIDGLDECQDNLDVIQTLLNNLYTTQVAVHLLFCSRDHVDILNSLSTHSEYLRLDDTHRTASIRAYAMQRLSKIKPLSGEKVQQWATNQICSAAQGLWLYARLMLDEIQQLPNLAMIRQKLQNIPRGLQQLYTQILTTLVSTVNDWQLAVAQQIFLWVDIGDFVLGGRIASFPLDILEFTLQYVSMGEPVHDSISLIRSLGAHLVDVFEVDDGVAVVDFIHHTSRQYVEWSVTAPASQVPIILKPRRLRELYCAATAAWYLSQHSQAKADRNRLRRNFGRTWDIQYFEMAYALWGAFKLEALPTHLDDEEVDQVTVLCNQLVQFLNSDQCLTWIEMAILINYAGGYPQLLDNVDQAIAASSEVHANGNISFESFRRARLDFFADYAHVIWQTAPQLCLQDSKGPRSAHTAPSGFCQRPLACKLMKIGRDYSGLYEANRQRKVLPIRLIRTFPPPVRDGDVSCSDAEGHEETTLDNIRRSTS